MRILKRAGSALFFWQEQGTLEEQGTLRNKVPYRSGTNEQGTLEVGESRWYNEIAVYYE